MLDLIGTFVFALSGAVVGVKRRLDIFGVLVLSFAAASAGGIMRDLLIDAVPPAAIRDWRYMGAAVLGGLLIFIWFPRSQRSSRVRNFVLLFDAGGLALFAVTGTQKALGYGLNPVVALTGKLTGSAKVSCSCQAQWATVDPGFPQSPLRPVLRARRAR